MSQVRLSKPDKSLLSKYGKKNGKPFLRQLIGPSNYGRNITPRILKIAKVAQDVDRHRVGAYFAEQKVLFNPFAPKTIPTPRTPKGTKDVFAEISARASEWDTLYLESKGQHFALPLMESKSSPLVSISESFDKYAKVRKPALCQALVSGTDLVGGHELQQLLRTSRMIRHAESSPKYSVVWNELKFARLTCENMMLEGLKDRHAFGLSPELSNFLGNMLTVTKAIHQKLAPLK
ncbi:MAG: hypothetical protein WCW44_03325 [archaeon]|jgi:hypothetical protein